MFNTATHYIDAVTVETRNEDEAMQIVRLGQQHGMDYTVKVSGRFFAKYEVRLAGTRSDEHQTLLIGLAQIHGLI